MTRPVLLATTLGCCLVACHGKLAPVGRLDVQPRALTLPSAEAVVLHLTWTPTAALGPDGSTPTVFVHLLDGAGKLLRTYDHPFPQAWSEGSTVNDEVQVYQSALAPPLAPGTYHLSVGLYQGDRRFALEGMGEPVGKSEYLAATVDVPATSDAPKFSYSDDWLPVDSGTDRQVLARRWLAVAAGTVKVEDVHQPGTLWMQLYIPPGNTGDEKLTLDPGAAGVPAVMVRGTCGPGETSISGTGEHVVEMPVNNAAGAGPCTVSLTPNFHIETSGEPKVRSVSLQNLAWLPGSPASPAKPAAPGS
jgi:hypothetical protein